MTHISELLKVADGTPDAFQVAMDAAEESGDWSAFMGLYSSLDLDRALHFGPSEICLCATAPHYRGKVITKLTDLVNLGHFSHCPAFHISSVDESLGTKERWDVAFAMALAVASKGWSNRWLSSYQVRTIGRLEFENRYMRR